MPETFSSNTAAGDNQQPTYDVRHETFLLDPAAETLPVLGNAVIIENTTVVPAGDGSYTPAYVNIAPTTLADATTYAGIVIGGSSLGTNPTAGGLVMVAVQGLVRALFDADTTYGDTADLSNATAGLLVDSGNTATDSATVAVICETLTITTPTLVWVRLGSLPIPSLQVGRTLALTYNAVGPFDVPCWGVPASWNGTGIVTVGGQITTGPGLVTGLEDVYGNPVGDGYSFPALLFIEGTVIYDIVGLNAFASPSGAAGLSWWGTSGGTPTLAIGAGGLFLPNLPGSDPTFVGQVWNNAGVLTVSAG